MNYIDMTLDKNVGLVMINKYEKFHEKNLNGPEVMSETCCKYMLFYSIKKYELKSFKPR